VSLADEPESAAAEDVAVDDKAAVESEIEEGLKTPAGTDEDHVDALVRKWAENVALQKEHDQVKAALLVAQAREALYTDMEADRAKELAADAMALDPDNKEAEKLYIEARAELGELPAVRVRTAEGMKEAYVQRYQVLLQGLGNAKSLAMHSSANGEYAAAVEQLRKAKTYVNVLSVCFDMQTEAQEIDVLLEQATKDLEKAERNLDALRGEEAAEMLERELERIEAASAMRRARQLEDVFILKNAGRHKDALKLLDRIKYENPTDIAPRLMEKDVAAERHKREMRDLTSRGIREGALHRELILERSIPYSEAVVYPSAAVWHEVISIRQNVLIPQVGAEPTAQDIEVIQHLDETVRLDFQDTDMRTVVQFLQEVTSPVKYSLETRDLSFDGSLITLQAETTLRQALHEICDLSGLDWKLKKGIIKIASPERLKEYEVRTYDIKDLLVNTEDYSARGGGITLGRSRDDDDDYRDGGGYDSYGSDYDGGRDRDRGRDFGIGEGASGSRESLRSRAEALTRLIMQTVRPETWKAGGVLSGPRDREEEGLAEDPWAEVGGPTAQIWEPPVEGAEAPGLLGPRGTIFLRSGAPGMLIITQTSDVHTEIGELLKSLRGAMAILVQVEARFIEVSSDFFSQVGFSALPIDTGAEEPDAEDPDIVVDTGLPYFSELTGLGLGLNINVTGPFQTQAFFQAVMSHESAKTLSCPLITLMNGMRGNLSIATSENYVGSFETQEEQFEPDVDTIDTSMLFDVRPIVSHDRRYVYLELAPTITDVLGYEEFTFTTAVSAESEQEAEVVPVENVMKLPKQLAQTFETTVAIPDRGTLLVGGLTKREEKVIERGAPVLSKIPLIKRLFTSEGKMVVDTTQLTLVRPMIIIMEEQEDSAY